MHARNTTTAFCNNGKNYLKPITTTRRGQGTVPNVGSLYVIHTNIYHSLKFLLLQNTSRDYSMVTTFWQSFLDPMVTGWSRFHDHTCIENNTKRLAFE